MSEDNKYGAVLELRSLLKYNSNYQFISKILTHKKFHEVYSLLLNSKYYTTIHFINSLYIEKYREYIDHFSGDVIELYSEIKIHLDKLPILYLVDYLDSPPDTLYYNKDIDINSTNLGDLYNSIVLKIKKKIYNIDITKLAKVCLLYSYIFKSLDLKESNSKIVSLKSFDNWEENGTINQLKYELSDIFDISKSTISNIKSIDLIYSSIVIGELEPDTSNIYTQFNSYILELLNSGMFSVNLIEWFIVLNFRNIKVFYDLLSFIFDINYNSIFIVFSSLKSLNHRLTRENVKRITENLVEKNLYPVSTIDTNEEVITMNLDVYNYIHRNVLDIKPFITVHSNFSDRHFNNGVFKYLTTLSPFEDNIFRLKRLNTLNYDSELDNDTIDLIKKYNAISIIKSSDDTCHFFHNGDKYINKYKLTNEDLGMVDKKILATYINNNLKLIGMTIDVVKDKDLLNYLNNINHPFDVIRKKYKNGNSVLT